MAMNGRVRSVALPLLVPAATLLRPRGAVADDGFLPHAVCYLWDTWLIVAHAVADSVIGLAYVAISLTLGYLVQRARRDVPFHWMVLAFGAFIIACGATHFMGVWTLWPPRYWLAGHVKIVTAVASLATALALPPAVPRALALIAAAKVSDERKRRLEAAHVELETAYRRITELDELKTRFFQNISHELRTPLGLILGPVEKLRGAPAVGEDERRELEVVERNARLLERRPLVEVRRPHT